VNETDTLPLAPFTDWEPTWMPSSFARVPATVSKMAMTCSLSPALLNSAP
jgi:hypothetical protein